MRTLSLYGVLHVVYAYERIQNTDDRQRSSSSAANVKFSVCFPFAQKKRKRREQNLGHGIS